MPAILELDNEIREYGWGSTRLIRDLLGIANPRGVPQAEMWLGAHSGAPSRVRVDGEWTSLADYISADPVSVLGREAAERFDTELPFLFKVLAAGKPLSLQAHPDEAQAREGFRREEALGIPREAKLRCYRDARPKPELLCALTRFEAMLGFREIAEIRVNLERLGLAELKPVIHSLEASRGAEALREFFASLMTNDLHWRQRVARDGARASERHADRPAYAWVCSLAADHPGDIGILAPLFLNLVTLEPGSAIFLQAGELHSYLSGCGVEIMANSDNVLRGGLTPKHVDVAQLLEVLSFASGPPEILCPTPDERGDRIYRTPAREFELSCLEVVDRGNAQTFGSDDMYRVSGPEIVLCVEGQVQVEPADTASASSLVRGASAFIPASIRAYRLAGRGRVYRASIPEGLDLSGKS